MTRSFFKFRQFQYYYFFDCGILIINFFILRIKINYPTLSITHTLPLSLPHSLLPITSPVSHLRPSNLLGFEALKPNNLLVSSDLSVDHHTRWIDIIEFWSFETNRHRYRPSCLESHLEEFSILQSCRLTKLVGIGLVWSES